MSQKNVRSIAVELLGVLHGDMDRLERIDRYEQGQHDDPYLPPNADTEYRKLAARAVTNWLPLLLSTPAQAIYVDDFRPGALSRAAVTGSPAAPTAVDVNQMSAAMQHWHDSGLDSRQIPITRGALKFGHSFVLTERRRDGKVVSKGLSAMRTAALWEDPANDEDPAWVLYVSVQPKGDAKGTARMWDGAFEYKVRFKSLSDADSVTVTRLKRHGASVTPVTRFAPDIDLEGRTRGLVEPLIPLQDRINQTVFDLLVAQTYASFKVRWVTGMAPPVRRDPETGDPELDGNGNPIPLPINHNARRFLFAEDENVKFGSLDETPLDGFIHSIEASVRHLAAISQTPPHHLLGQIANLSAEALLAAETALARKVEEFRKSFGESWARVFRVAAELNNDPVGATDYLGEVIWRDMEQRSLAQSADALFKLKDLGIPVEGLWARVPNVTASELTYWRTLREQNPDSVFSESVTRSTGAIFDRVAAERNAA